MGWYRIRSEGVKTGLLSFGALLGGSWVVISGVISRAAIVIVPIYGLRTTHEPPSTVRGLDEFNPKP